MRNQIRSLERNFIVKIVEALRRAVLGCRCATALLGVPVLLWRLVLRRLLLGLLLWPLLILLRGLLRLAAALLALLLSAFAIQHLQVVDDHFGRIAIRTVLSLPLARL